MKFCFNVRFCNNDNLPTESPVIGGQSLSPAQICSLTAQGRAASMTALESVMQYVPCNHLDNMPSEFIRGIDDVELWNLSQDSQQKLRDFKRSTAQKAQHVTPSSQAA